MTWIASRTLKDAETGATLVVSLGVPQQVTPEEWTCAFHIDGIPPDEDQQSHGVDGLQALVMAIEGIRVTLARSGRSLTWEGGEPGDHGIPQIVPHAFGLVVSRHLERLLEEELRFFGELAQAWASRKR
jgi:hypothetical protein